MTGATNKSNGNNIDFAELESLLTGYWLSDLANFVAFFQPLLPDINWIGFFLSDKKALRLGPFWGKPACVKIAFGQGVCGTAFEQKSPLIVDDVDKFEGHIRCDSASKSEMVLPLVVDGEILGVLDIDSPKTSRFKQADQELLEKGLQILATKLSKYSGARFGKLSDGSAV